MKPVRTCTRCVMNDSSDKSIVFDAEGRCNYCADAIAKKGIYYYFSPDDSQKRLDALLSMIKEENKNKPYDCVMGISGGLDSAYLAYLGYKWGLRILAVHIDDGFDTEVSKSNIEKLCKAADIELRVITPDPEQYYDLILAYMKAGVPNLAIPQDNILLAFLYNTVRREGLKHFLSGENFALESILQKDHLFDALDLTNLRNIHKRYGTKGLDKLEFVSTLSRFIMVNTKKMISHAPLNLIDYNRERAFRELSGFCGFEYYGGKHLENILTAFLQLCWLPEKFGLDKRSSHLSSLVVSGQMSREEALRELEKPLYDEKMMDGYINIIKSRLAISDADFDAIMAAPVHAHEEYGTDRTTKLLGDAYHLAKSLFGK